VLDTEIPERYASLARIVATACAELDPGNEFMPLGQQRWIRQVGLNWADPVEAVALVLDPSAGCITAYVILRLGYDDAQRAPLTEAIARANYGLPTGSFEIDVDAGQVRYRSALPLDIGEIRPEHIARLLSEALEMADEYAAALRSVAEAGADPRAAVAAVEGS
jgi:hypothetical protein